MLRALRRTLVIAGVLVFVDAFVLNQGVIALVTALGALIGGVPRARLAWRHGEPTTARLRAARTGIYVLVAVLVLGANFANAQLARRRADTLIAACRQYEARQGRLPDRLDELAPDFIPSVPLAKYTLMPPFNMFMYMARPGQHSLMWVAFPPFGRPYYVFEDNRWGFLD